MNWSLIPHFRKRQTGTTYELLTAVKEAILAEPKRVDMGGWLSIENAYSPEPEVFAACGTQGCIAGWMYSLAASSDKQLLHAYVPEVAYGLFPKSAAVRQDVARLFHGTRFETPHGYIDYTKDAPYPFPSFVAGTADYAKAVAANITKFQRKHRKALQAHKLQAKRVFDNVGTSSWD